MFQWFSRCGKWQSREQHRGSYLGTGENRPCSMSACSHGRGVGNVALAARCQGRGSPPARCHGLNVHTRYGVSFYFRRSVLEFLVLALVVSSTCFPRWRSAGWQHDAEGALSPQEASAWHAFVWGAGVPAARWLLREHQ